MKIFLTNPPTHDQSRFTREGRCQQAEGVWTTVWPPLSLAQSAAVLREAGFEVFAADAPTQGWDMREYLLILETRLSNARSFTTRRVCGTSLERPAIRMGTDSVAGDASG